MYSPKDDYSLSFNKRAVQSLVFKSYKERKIKKLIGLGGPNIRQYLLFLKSQGIKHAEIYEYDISKMAIQLSKYQPVIESQIKYQDILNAEPNRPDTLYDLDFCCSIKSAANHVYKFTDNVIITLSIRPIGLNKTISEFAKLVDRTTNPEFEWIETITNKLGKFKLYKLTTKKHKYDCYVYKDSTPMLTIKSL